MSRRVFAFASAVIVISACAIQRTQPNGSAKSLASSSVPASGMSSGMSSMPSMSMDEHMAHMSAADMAVPTASASTQQGIAGLPASNSTAEARLKASPRHGEWVKIPWEKGSKDSLMAWIVYPASATANAKAPVVVVVHEIFGLSAWVRAVADQAAADGFIAIAPDILSKVRGGPSTEDISTTTGRQLIAGVSNADRSLAIIASANYAMTRPSAVPKYGVIGYCWGGQTVFYHAINGGVKGYSGGVAYYGLPYMNNGTPATATTAATPATFIVDSLKKINQPIMLLNGAGDSRIAAAMPALDSLMKSLGKDYSGTNYPGASHGFLRAQDDQAAKRDEALEAANLAATKDAWPKTIAFLKKNLGVK